MRLDTSKLFHFKCTYDNLIYLSTIYEVLIIFSVIIRYLVDIFTKLNERNLSIQDKIKTIFTGNDKIRDFKNLFIIGLCVFTFFLT